MLLVFEKEFKISTFALHLNGAHPDALHDKKWVAKFTFVNMLSSICFNFLVNSIMSHDIRNGKYTDAIKNGTMAIVFLSILFKYFILFHHQNSMKNYMNIIRDDYSAIEQFTKEEKHIILEYARKGTNVCKLALISTSFAGAVFLLKAMYFMTRSYFMGEFELAPMFDMTYPKLIETHKDIVYVFWFLFVLCIIFDVHVTSMYIGFDPLVSIFLLHVCGQIDILSRRMKKVMVGVTDINEINENLKKINEKLQALYTFINSMQSNFTELFEFNMKTTTFLLPFAAFQIVQSLHRLELNMEFICFFAAIITYFFIPCYYSDLLMDKGNSLREAIYACGWENQPNIRIRKTVLFMLTRCNIPLGMRTIFCPLNLETFAEMCRQAYALFNIMNAVWF